MMVMRHKRIIKNSDKLGSGHDRVLFHLSKIASQPVNNIDRLRIINAILIGMLYSLGAIRTIGPSREDQPQKMWRGPTDGKTIDSAHHIFDADLR